MTVTHVPLFPTLVSTVGCEFFDLVKPRLIEWLYEYRKNSETVCNSNRGGWQSTRLPESEKTFFEYAEYIKKTIAPALKCYNLRFHSGGMWANINKKGDYNVEHDHPGCEMAGVFWIKTPENCGSLTFRHPEIFRQYALLTHINEEIGVHNRYCNDVSITPQEGTIILFPSSLRHEVEPNESDEDRVSIAFNLVCERY